MTTGKLLSLHRYDYDSKVISFGLTAETWIGNTDQVTKIIPKYRLLLNELFALLQLDQADTVRTLLSAGADAGVQNRSGQTPFELVQSEQVKDVFNQELLQATAQSK